MNFVSRSILFLHGKIKPVACFFCPLILNIELFVVLSGFYFYFLYTYIYKMDGLQGHKKK